MGPAENGNPLSVSILAEPASSGNYMVETKLTTGVPFDNSCCYNFAQRALFIYGDDDSMFFPISIRARPSSVSRWGRCLRIIQPTAT